MNDEGTPVTPRFEPIPCLGILGRVFGHKFTKLGWQQDPVACYRCGIPAGRAQRSAR